MPTKNIRFLLKEIEIYYDGDEFVDEGKVGREPYDKKYLADKNKYDNIVLAMLEYPRSGTAMVSTTKMMDLPSRRLVKLNTADFWESGLFKEDIDTETKFKLVVSDRDSVSKVGLWFRKIFSAVINTALGGKVKAITNLFQGAVASDLQTRLVTSVKGEQKGSGITSLCASKEICLKFNANGVEAYWFKGSTKVDVLTGDEITVDLFSTGTFHKKVGKTNKPDSRLKESKKELQFRKNQKLGTAKIILIGV